MKPQPVVEPTASPPAATPVAAPIIIVPSAPVAGWPAWAKGQQVGEWRKAGTDSMSALEQRSLNLGELGLIDATHYIFGVYGFGTITDRDEIVGGQWGGHNGGDNNCGIIVPIAGRRSEVRLPRPRGTASDARTERSERLQQRRFRTVRIIRTTQPQFDAVRRTLILSRHGGRLV